MGIMALTVLLWTAAAITERLIRRKESVTLPNDQAHNQRTG